MESFSSSFFLHIFSHNAIKNEISINTSKVNTRKLHMKITKKLPRIFVRHTLNLRQFYHKFQFHLAWKWDSRGGFSLNYSHYTHMNNSLKTLNFTVLRTLSLYNVFITFLLLRRKNRAMRKSILNFWTDGNCLKLKSTSSLEFFLLASGILHTGFEKFFSIYFNFNLFHKHHWLQNLENSSSDQRR